MTLLAHFLLLLAQWQPLFSQQRTWQRAVAHAFGTLVCLGRRTLTRILWTNGRQHCSWGQDYLFYSRSPWDPQSLFLPLLRQALAFCPNRFVGVAVDDTRLRKTGRSIPQASYHRDPLSPPFHTNLMLGLRFLQASLLLPLHRQGAWAARGLPIRFEEVSVVKKPGKRASAQAQQQYKKDRKLHNLSQRFLQTMQALRSALDQAGGLKKLLLLAVDGSFCNRTVFSAIPPRAEIIARCRKDAVLCFRAEQGSRRFYSSEVFTPEQVRKDDTLPWKTTKIFYGGKRRKIRYKEVLSVLWRGGAKRRLLRLFVLAPTPYRKRKSSRLYYRQPAYLLTSVLSGSSRQLLQIYFDRWQIEVNHRDEKDTLGVGQAQFWNPVSVPKQPAFAVASYAALLLASLKAFGPGRGDAYAPLPKWRRKSKRPSCLDLITLLRKEAVEQPELLESFRIKMTDQALHAAAAA